MYESVFPFWLINQRDHFRSTGCIFRRSCSIGNSSPFFQCINFINLFNERYSTHMCRPLSTTFTNIEALPILRMLKGDHESDSTYNIYANPSINSYIYSFHIYKVNSRVWHYSKTALDLSTWCPQRKESALIKRWYFSSLIRSDLFICTMRCISVHIFSLI